MDGIKASSISKPQDNKYICVAVLIDMADEVRDVVGVLHFCSINAKDAQEKASLLFQQQGLLKEGGKYHLQVGVVGELPDKVSRVVIPTTSQSKVITANG